MGSIILSADYSDSTGHMATHLHDCHQLLYILQGQATVTVSGRQYRAVPGTAVLISRFEQHAIQAESASYRRFSLQISPEAAVSDPLFSLLVNRPEHFFHAVQLPQDSGASDILLRILQEHRTNNLLGNKMQQLLLQQLLILVYRAHPESLSYEESELLLIRRIQQQFEGDHGAKYTLQSLSRQYHISPSHLSHLFKKVTGTSVMGYLTDCRFAAAKRYLAETDLPIGTVLELCGFTDSSNFSRSFKAATGLSPTAFRSQFRSHTL